MYAIVNSVTGNRTIYYIEENLWIPFDPANRHYQAYLAWVAEGNTAEEWQPDGE